MGRRMISSRWLPFVLPVLTIMVVGCESKTPTEPGTVKTSFLTQPEPVVTPPITRTSATFVRSAAIGPVEMTLFFQLKAAATTAVSPSAASTCVMVFDGELRPEAFKFWVFKAEDDAACGTGKLPLEGVYDMVRSSPAQSSGSATESLTYEVSGTYRAADGSQGSINGTLTGTLGGPSGVSGTMTTRVLLPDPPPPPVVTPPIGSATIVYKAPSSVGFTDSPDRMEVTYSLESVSASALQPLATADYCPATGGGQLTSEGILIGVTGPQQTGSSQVCTAFPVTFRTLPILRPDLAPELVRGRWRFFASYTMPGTRTDTGTCTGTAVGVPPLNAVLQDVVCRHVGTVPSAGGS